MRFALRQAVDVLLSGGVIAYPTEGVYGFGCLADEEDAILRLLTIKRRPIEKGLIVIVAERQQLQGWVDDASLARIPDPERGKPVTWIVPAGRRASALICGAHDGIAIRVTAHPVARTLCAAADSPLISTSANVSGRPVVRNRWLLQKHFRNRVDAIVPGDLGDTGRASQIRRLDNQQIIRDT